MYFSNFTTDKPSVDEQSSASSTFGSGRDIAYLVFSILQFLVTVFALIWVNYIIRNKDKKDEKERLEKEERDKLADIINNEYNKIVEDGIVDKLRECKAKVQAMVMFHGSAWETRGRKYKITGLDILRYKLLNPNVSEMSEGMPLRKLQQDLDAVMRLFQSLRIKLPLKGECPQNIREELGPLINDIGEIARSFVPAKKRYTIAHVMKYFGNGGQAVKSKRDEEKKDENDNRKARRTFPYLNKMTLFPNVEQSYQDKDFYFLIILTPLHTPLQHEIIRELQFVDSHLCNKGKPIKAEDLGRFANKIDAVWKRNFPAQLPIPDWSKKGDLRGNVLHAVRVSMFKVKEGSDIINDGEFKELVHEMRNITYVQEPEMQKRRSEWIIRKISKSLEMLENPCNAHLCEQKSIADMLERVKIDLNTSIGQALGRAREPNSDYL